ncbi:ABC transporter substrate-binding protein [Cellulomonas aerilata]|uniref:Sugar ABC transporter substrate-binding protein n=1 Tax=Cellulomonas aerilata TaxID=515326 RepID=A0A512DCF1_9CELL|nr:sugar ABC transporter substrate-binding protein [Cellulomonas aerilata]GEO34162.1 sugar ABC transporter substrate-binding protein [Cellulomonas aerilata]
MDAKTLSGHGWRRRTAIITAGMLSLAGLTACGTGDSGDSGDAAAGGASADGPVEVDFWGWVPGLEGLVDTWNADNPDIQVSFHRMTGDDGQKVEAAVDAGTGPDLVQLSTHNLPDYVIQGRVQDITEYVTEHEDNYTEASWASVSFDGKVYGVPQGIGPSGMMYRTDILEQHGIAVPTTWDEYLEAARALHAADPEVYIANMSPGEIGQWVQEVQQAEGSWFGIDGDAWTVGVNDEASKQVAERWQTLLDEGLVTTELMWTPEYWARVNAGDIATISYAAWFPVALAENAADTSGRWRVAPMPTNEGSDNQGDSGGAAVVVLDGAQDPAAAAEFASWLNGSDDTQDTLITEGGLFPSTKNGLASPALRQEQEFYGGQVINEVFIESAEHTPSTWTEGPNWGTAQTAVLDEFAKVVGGSQTFTEALDNAQAATVADLEARGLTVKD